MSDVVSRLPVRYSNASLANQPSQLRLNPAPVKRTYVRRGLSAAPCAADPFPDQARSSTIIYTDVTAVCIGHGCRGGRMFQKILAPVVAAATLLAVQPVARAADTVEMLHWWTSGGEAAALKVIKDDLTKEGYQWKDVPVAGGGGEAAMTTLKAMVAAGHPPTASQILGYFAIDYAEAGKLADLNSLAKKGDWAKVIPTALQKFTTTNGTWDAVPINIHSVNWLWINKPLADKIGAGEPKTFADFLAMLDKAKAAGAIPLA